MSERASSPEERLLRLIRGQQPVPAGGPGAAPLRPAAKSPKLRVPSNWPWVVNAALVVLLAVSVGALVWALVQPVALPAAMPAEPIPLPPPPADPPALDAQPFQRQLFQQPVTTAVPADNGAAHAAAQQQAQAAIASFTLMGIMEGHPPQAILADAQTQKTLFVKEGETFGPGILVEKIAAGRVTVSYQGATQDLQL